MIDKSTERQSEEVLRLWKHISELEEGHEIMPHIAREAYSIDLPQKVDA